MTWRLVEPDPGSDLDVTGDPLVLRARVIEGEVGVAEMLEWLWHLRVAQFLLAHQVRGVREVLVPADMIEVEVRVHHEGDVVEVVSGVVHDQAVGMLYEDAVDGEPDRRADVDVPQDLRAIDDERAAIQ